MKNLVANKSKCILSREYNYEIKGKHFNDSQDIRKYLQLRRKIYREKFDGELEQAKCSMKRCREYRWKAKKVDYISQRLFMNEILDKEHQENHQLFQIWQNNN